MGYLCKRGSLSHRFAMTWVRGILRGRPKNLIIVKPNQHGFQCRLGAASSGQLHSAFKDRDGQCAFSGSTNFTVAFMSRRLAVPSGAACCVFGSWPAMSAGSVGSSGSRVNQTCSCTLMYSKPRRLFLS